jgi:hypothetical protein
MNEHGKRVAKSRRSKTAASKLAPDRATSTKEKNEIAALREVVGDLQQRCAALETIVVSLAAKRMADSERAFTVAMGPSLLARELSGPAWVARFPGSSKPVDCVQPFRGNLERFLAALKAASAQVAITSTLRPPERAYLMHYAWAIAKNGLSPASVPAMAGVEIEWSHRDTNGSLDLPKSRAAALAMVQGYGLKVQAVLKSRHTEGRAVDMDVTWQGTLTIADADGTTRTIASEPRTGLNADLHSCGKSYGVIKASFYDPPHWSDDGS